MIGCVPYIPYMSCDWLLVGGIVCSGDDLRAIVHEHQVRWSPQSMSTSRRGGQRSSRASSLDTTSHSQSAVFSSSVESLSQFPVFPATQNIDKQVPLADHTDSAVPQQSAVPGSSAVPSNANNQLQRKVAYIQQPAYSLVTL